MKKSEIYKELQRIVLHYKGSTIAYDGMLETLRELFAQEDLAKYQEKLEEEHE